MKSKKLKTIIIIVSSILLLALLVGAGISVAKKIESDKKDRITEEIINLTPNGCDQTIGEIIDKCEFTIKNQVSKHIDKTDEKDVYKLSLGALSYSEASSEYLKNSDKNSSKKEYNFVNVSVAPAIEKLDQLFEFSISVYYNAKTKELVDGESSVQYFAPKYQNRTPVVYDICRLKGDTLESAEYWFKFICDN